MPPASYHVTVATALKFMSERGLAMAQPNRTSPAARAAYERRWTSLLRTVWDELKGDGVPVVELQLARVEVHASCVILLFEDPSGALEALRARLRVRRPTPLRTRGWPPCLPALNCCWQSHCENCRPGGWLALHH